MESSEKITFRNIKIKKEKLSPPPKQTKDADEIMNEIIPTLFGISNNSDENNDEKKSIEPAKSSNEILAELFKVFNAKPPETLLNDNYIRSKTDIKKHKKHKKQKNKKSRKKGRSSSDDDDNNIENNDKSTKKHHKKKKKKSKKHSDLSDDQDVDSTGDINKINIKTEEHDDYDGGTPPQSQEIQNRIFDKINESDFTISDLDDNNGVSDKNPKLKDITTNEIKKEKIVIDKSPVRDSGKIVIKSLINTQIFKDAEQKQQKEKDRKERHHRQHKDRKSSKTVKRESDDSLSLSDEETYLKERENYYKQSSRDGKSSSYRRDDDFYDRKNRYSSSRRDRDRNYRDSSRDRFRSSWRDGHDHRRSRSRSRRRSRSQDLKIDKKRLLEIARKNAITMFKKGSLPGTQTMTQEIKDKVLLKMRYGGKTVEDLTDFCKKLSNGDNLNDLSDLSSNGDSDHDRDGNDKAFHHPFVLKDRGPIVMNIKNAIPIPPKSAEQTKAILMQFPVSSGQHHRLNEGEWVPVPQTKKTDVTTVVVKPPIVVAAPIKPQATKNIFAKPLPDEQQQPAFVPVPTPGTITDSITTPTSDSIPVPIVQTPVSIPQELEIINSIFTIPPPAPPPTPPAITPQETIMQQESETVISSANDNIFPTNNVNLDVSSIITKRLNAMRRLQDNPMDSEAIKMMYNAQKDMSEWANSKHIPGQFTGSTGVNVLSARELNAGYQPWARKDQLTSTTPVSGGMGMHLLQKMGWKPGEGLGRERNGALQPLLLEVKLDKRGLLADEEDPKRKILLKRKRLNPPPTIAQAQEDFESKHPVSLLGELATKRRWTAPAYELVNDNGPPHSRNFIFKVIVNGIVYQPSISSNTKKQAKATAAKYCLQQMGVLPV